VRLLLGRGYRVRGVVRDLKQKEKLAFLHELPRKHSSCGTDPLELVEGDLQEGKYGAILQGKKRKPTRKKAFEQKKNQFIPGNIQERAHSFIPPHPTSTPLRIPRRRSLILLSMERLMPSREPSRLASVAW